MVVYKGTSKGELKQGQRNSARHQKSIDEQQNSGHKKQIKQLKQYARVRKSMAARGITDRDIAGEKKPTRRSKRKHSGYSEQHQLLFTLVTLGVLFSCGISQVGASVPNGRVGNSSSLSLDGYNNFTSSDSNYSKISYNYNPIMRSNITQENESLPLLHLSTFSRVDNKQSGKSTGGIYQDQNGTKYVMKHPQKNDQNSLIRELVGSKIASTIMGEEGALAPVSFVLNDRNNLIMIASKFNENYISKATLGSEFRTINDGDYTLNGNIISGNSVAPVILAMFVEDMDLNDGNVGVLNKNSLIKIDFGYAFDPDYINYMHRKLSTFESADPCIDLSQSNCMLNKIKTFYRKVYSVDFNDLIHSIELIDALDKILAISEKELVDAADETIQQYIKVIEPIKKVSPKYDRIAIENQREDIISILRANRASFQEILDIGVCETPRP